MSRVAPKDAKRLSFEEYLELEERSPTRHEFVDGFMFAMAGGTPQHNQISNNINIRAALASRASSCRVYIADVKVRTPDGVGFYPDVFVICNEDDEDRQNNRVKRHPCFIVEVLSPSTEAFDRGEKFLRYLQIPSLKAYILVSQDRKLVEVYRRMSDDSQPENTWRYEKIQDDGTLKLPCINLTMTLEDVYEDVEFQTSTELDAGGHSIQE